jgi:hypothetical protein
MPIPTTTYKTFASLATTGTRAFSPQWSKTVEADRLLNAIFDESLNRDGTPSTATVAARFTALHLYLYDKWGMCSDEYKALAGDRRQEIRDITLNNQLISNGETAIGRCGRFHRVLTSVYNETVGHADKEADFQAWCVAAVSGIATALGITPPDGPAVPTVMVVSGGGYDHPHSDHH